MGYLRRSIVEIHEALLKGLVTPKELLDEALNKAHKDTNNAFEIICDDFAYDLVGKLKDKNRDNLLWGIPFVIKDNFSTKGIKTCASSNILNDYTPIFDAEVVSRLIKAGAILIGKTTLDEFGMGGHGKSGHNGFVYNPWDKSHAYEIGGSSSGSAASVSAGIVPFSIGSDTGDSVRKPASYSSLVGFKPSWGRISRYGLFPFAVSLDHVAFFTRNVKDSSIVLKCLAGYDEKDQTSSENPVGDYLENISSDINGKHVAVVKEIFDALPDNEIKSSFVKLIGKIKENGGVVDFVHIDRKLCDTILPIYFVLSSSEATSNLACFDGIKYGLKIDENDYENSLIKTRTKGFSEQTRRRLIFGAYSLNKDNYANIYVKAQKIKRLVNEQVNKILQNYECILLPASPDIAPKFSDTSSQDLDNILVNNYMAIANFAGLPSITIPLGFSRGLPFGVNITTKLFDEQGALDIASSIENITGIKDLSVK